MSEDAVRHLRIVDEDGQLLDHCPSCHALEIQLEGAEKNLRSLRASYVNLKRDKDAEARGNDLWPQAIALFRYWAEKTGHGRARFTEDRFWLVAPFLKQDKGLADCRSAIRGCLASDYHMKRGQFATRKGPIHDAFELVFRNQANFERFRDMDPEERPTIAKATLMAHAREVAGRVLERAKLIEHADDPIACSQLLIEIDRLNRDWLALPDTATPDPFPWLDETVDASERLPWHMIAAELGC